jgi:hypothetical protein
MDFNHEPKNTGYRPGKINVKEYKQVDSPVDDNSMSNFMDYLRNKYPSISNRKEYLLSDRKCGSIYGEMMAGKSAAFIATHHYYQMCGIASIMCVEQSSAIKQFEKSIEDYNNVYEKYFNKKKWVPKPIEYELANTLGLDGITNEIIDPENIVDVFRVTGRPKMIITIAHQDQCYRLIKLIYMVWGDCPTTFREYAVVFDESHLTMFPNDAECRLDDIILPEDTYNGDWPIKLTKYESITHLIFFARQIIAGTATPQQNWFSEFHSIQFIIDINPGVGYRDVLSLDYTIIPDLRDISVVDDPALHKVLEELVVSDRYNKNKYRMDRDHPISMLINVSRYTKDHKAILDYIIKHHRDKFVVVTLNDEGTHVHFPEHISKYIHDKHGGVVKLKQGTKKIRVDEAYITKNNRVFYKNVPIASTLQFVADLPDQLVERIILISGDMVKQGCRISSYDFTIRLTHEFIRDTSSLGDNLLQKLRLVGYVYDNRPSLVVYCTDDTHKRVVSGIKTIRDELDTLKRDLNDINTFKTDSTLDILRKKTICKDKVCYKAMCKNKMPMQETSDSEDDFDLTVSDYNTDIQRTNAGKVYVKMPKSTCKKSKCDNKTRHSIGLCGSCRESKSHIITPDSADAWIKLCDCYNRKGKLYNIVNLFVIEELRSLSSDELANVCDNKFQYDNYNHWDLGRSSKYHIMTKVGYGQSVRWNIRTEVLDALHINY